MSQAAPVAITEMQQALQKLEQIQATQQKHADAINGLGANVQWLVDNVQGIFQMFGSPQFSAMLPSILGSAASGLGNVPDDLSALKEAISNGDGASEE